MAKRSIFGPSFIPNPIETLFTPGPLGKATGAGDVAQEIAKQLDNNPTTSEIPTTPEVTQPITSKIDKAAVNAAKAAEALRAKQRRGRASTIIGNNSLINTLTDTTTTGNLIGNGLLK